MTSELRKTITMAGLDPATPQARVGAPMALASLNASQTRRDWVAGSSPAMEVL
jgi:hypothetical protein